MLTMPIMPIFRLFDICRSAFSAPAIVLLVALSLLQACSEAPDATDSAADESQVPAVAPTDAGAESEPAPVVEAPARDPRLALFAPLPEIMTAKSNPVTLAKVNLGRKLYYDPRLSVNQDVSCNTCHQLDKYGVDNLPTSVGHAEQVGERNAPSVYNAAGHVAQFWDGRSPDVEDQAKGPPLNPLEMGMPDDASVEAVLRSIPGYAPLFAAAFPDEEEPVTFDNMGKAIGAFERGLVTRSRFDNYLAGDDEALTSLEKEGLTAFLDVGCAACHSGPYLGGSIYQKVGLVKPWEDASDLGRFDITGDAADKQVFKVPSLRNVSHTAPYFHDGSVPTLNEAVRLMAEHQRGLTLNNEQVISIIAFLNALDGKIDLAYVAKPALPESGATTPGPDPS